MRSFVLWAVLASACGGTAAPSKASPTVVLSPGEAAPPVAEPPAPSGPAIRIAEEAIMLDGERVGSVRTIRDHGGRMKVDALFDALAARRKAWLADHPDEAFPGEASMVVDPATPMLVMTSVVATTAYAGFPAISVLLEGKYVALRIPLPEPPCVDCPEEAPGYRLHVGIEVDRYRWAIPREADRLEGQGGDPAALRAELTTARVAANVHAVVLHVAPEAPFGGVQRYLRAVADVAEGHAGHLVIATGPFDTVPERAKPTTRAANVSGRLPPEDIQRIVRSRFSDLRSCYERVLAADAEAEGRLVVHFTIDWDGSVSATDVVLPDTLAGSIGDCIADVVRALRFPAPGGGIVRVTYPIVFSLGE